MESAGNSFSVLLSRYETSGKKAALAAQIHESDSQLSKLVHTHGPKLCALLDAMGLELVDKQVVSSMRVLLKEHL